jgi:hypothetical protein
VARDFYAGLILEYDKIANGNTVLSAMEVFAAENPAVPRPAVPRPEASEKKPAKKSEKKPD